MVIANKTGNRNYKKKRNMTEKILLLFPPCSTLDVKNTVGSYAQNVQFTHDLHILSSITSCVVSQISIWASGLRFRFDFPKLFSVEIYLLSISSV